MMPKHEKVSAKSEEPVTYRPSITPEAQENHMITLAVNLAEKQLRDGTASAQVITHYLKLGSSKERAERELLSKQTELAAAKAESIRSTKRSDEMYDRVIAAMRSYSGMGDEYADQDL